jgi:hypothetical protein
VAWPGSSVQSWIDRGTMAAVNRGFARVAGARLSSASNAKQSFVPSMLRPLRGIPFNSVIWWQGCAHCIWDTHMLCALRTTAVNGDVRQCALLAQFISLQHVHYPGGSTQTRLRCVAC